MTKPQEINLGDAVCLQPLGDGMYMMKTIAGAEIFLSRQAIDNLLFYLTTGTAVEPTNER